MAVTPTPIYPQTIKNAAVTIVNADGSTLKTVLTAGANGSKVENILVTSTDGTDRDINVYITVSGTDYLVGTVKIALNTGNTNAIPSLNLLASSQLPTNLDAQGNHYLYLIASGVLKVAATTTVTSAKTITFTAQYGDF